MFTLTQVTFPLLEVSIKDDATALKWENNTCVFLSLLGTVFSCLANCAIQCHIDCKVYVNRGSLSLQNLGEKLTNDPLSMPLYFFLPIILVTC